MNMVRFLTYPNVGFILVLIDHKGYIPTLHMQQKQLVPYFFSAKGLVVPLPLSSN
jgi:hypothetical protein